MGVSTLLAVYDKDGPQLYLVDPAGTSHVSGPHGTQSLLWIFVRGCKAGKDTIRM
jgi:hypothetical protein